MFAAAAGIVGVVGACVDTRGLAISGTGEGIEVMAREDESPWALEGEYGDDWFSSRAVEWQHP